MQQSMQKRTQQVTLMLGDNGQQCCVRLHGALDFLSSLLGKKGKNHGSRSQTPLVWLPFPGLSDPP